MWLLLIKLAIIWIKGGQSWTTFQVLEKTDDKIGFQISELLLFCVSSNNDTSNTCTLNATIQYILATKKFDVPSTNCIFLSLTLLL